MLQINHLFSSIELLKTEIDAFGVSTKSEDILIQLFTSILDKEYLKKIIKDILELFPNATLIGSTTDGEIIDGTMLDDSVVLGISVFEKTKIKSTYFITDDSHTLGVEIAKEVISLKSKCIITFADGLMHNGEIYLESLNNQNKNNIPVAGGMAADGSRFEKTFTIYGDKIFSGGGVSVSLEGDNLEVYNDYNLGWKAVGPHFTITKAKNNTVYEIDNRPTLDIYKEVLGESVLLGFPNSTIEFPLIKKIDNISIARSAVKLNDDGSVVYAGNLKNGDKVQFGLGSTNLVNEYKHLKELDENDIQASFIYSCSARKKFLGKNLESIYKDLASISPSVGFFTYGEFFNSLNDSKFLNITTTLLFLNEKDTKQSRDKVLKSKIDIKSYSKDAATLHLIDYMTHELERRELEVSHIQQITNEYLNAIDTTLIVSRTDIHGRITFANDKFAKISGYSVDELIGQPHSIVRHPSNKSEFFENMWDTIESGRIWQGSFPNLRKDGTTYYVTSSIIPIHDIYGKVIEYLAIREDVSELVEARMRAEHAEANQAAFLANMSHEIRTPMNGILGFSELLLETKLNKTQNEYTNIIKNSTKTLINIVNDIL
ncbi:MAG: PAS domain S-box protein, partial [Campylobacterales bacterium]|nr:PAS domain S-box protein [Campylobacterales bacterium]